MRTEIPTLDNSDVAVEHGTLRAGVAIATLYRGDPDLICDYLATPEGELDIHGCIHHIHMTHESGEFTLDITSMYGDAVAVFDGLAARELIFALAKVDPTTDSPSRK